jgi:hypothetical protein
MSQHLRLDSPRAYLEDYRETFELLLADMHHWDMMVAGLIPTPPHLKRFQGIHAWATNNCDEKGVSR